MPAESYDLPPRRLPIFYFTSSTIFLIVALVNTVRYAQDFTGFYYHPRILALTHLVTLGYITGNILGFLFVVAPMALHTHLRVRWPDVLAFLLFVIGVSGMASHFWISGHLGMAYSAVCVYAALLLSVMRWFHGFVTAKRLPGFVRFHILLAFMNLMAAGGLGLLVAINKNRPFLPTLPAANVLAHAHLAAIGWVMMLVFGIAYRLLPMFVPGAPAKGKLPWISAILLESGILGLFISLLLQSNWNLLFAILIVSGILLFLYEAIQTALHRKPSPPPMPPRPDFAMLHVAAAFLCLFFAAALGLLLTRLAPTEESLRLALVYAFLALVGFFTQMIVGIKPKVLSILTWYYAFNEAGDNHSIPRPVDMPVRPIQGTVFALWMIGIPVFAAGVLKASRIMVSAGAVSLLAATVLDTLHAAVILRSKAKS